MSAKPRRRRRKNSSPRFGKILGIIALTFILLIFGGYQWARSYVKSDAFRVFLGSKVGELFHSEARFSPFSWTGSQVSSPSLEIGNSSISAERVTAELQLSSVFDGYWHIPSLRLQEVHISSLPKAPEKPTTSNSAKHFLSGILPKQVQVDRIDIPHLSAKKETHSISNSSLTAIKSQGQNGYDLTLHGGKISSEKAIIPEGKLVKANLRVRQGSAYLTDSSITVLEHGKVSLQGEYLSARKWQLSGSYKDISCEEILPEDWVKRLTGTIKGDFNTSAHSPTTGHVELDNAILTTLPILDTLAAYTDIIRFRRLTLNTAQLDYSLKADTTHLTNIELISTGLISITGDLTIIDRQLDGTFQVGITPGTLSSIPGAETKVFTTLRDGMLWAPMRLTGTLDSPKQDLSDRIIRAAQDRLFETLPESGQLAFKYSTDVATEAFTTVLEESKKLLNGDQINTDELLKDGTKTLKDGVDSILEAFPAGDLFRSGK